MSRRTYLGEELEVEKVVIADRDECEYKIDRKCSNNYNMRWLGKVCRFKCSEECEYYKKESGVTGWKE